MKLLTAKLAAALFAISIFPGFAQIPNAGFEQTNQDGAPSHWSANFFRLFWIDSTGAIHGDTILFEEGLAVVTTEARSGGHAMELRNAYNQSQQQAVAGQLFLSADSVFSSFAFLIPLSSTPSHFGFWHKFRPMGADTAIASLHVYNELGEAMGGCLLKIHEQTEVYTPVAAPISYYGPGVASYFALSFINTTGFSAVSMGTHFLIDDVVFENLTATATPLISEGCMVVFPNPGSNRLNISKPNVEEETAVEITDVIGRCVFSAKIGHQPAMDVSGLAPGNYVVKVSPRNGPPQQTRWVKK